MESVAPSPPLRRVSRARHALGPIALLMAVIAAVLTVVGALSTGTAAGEVEAVYGQPLQSIPGNQLPSTVLVYISVGVLGVLLALAALVCGLVAFLRLGCRVAGPIAVAVCLFIPAAVIVSYALTAQPT